MAESDVLTDHQQSSEWKSRSIAAVVEQHAQQAVQAAQNRADSGVNVGDRDVGSSQDKGK